MKVYKKERENLVLCDPEELFTFLRGRGNIVSLIGAGGKTTLLYDLAQLGAKKGLRTLVTTTTHIYEPKNGYYAKSTQEIERLWAENKPAVVGTRTAEEKLKPLSREVLDNYCRKAELVLIEADGAKGKPCKAPRAHEPVLLPECDTVLGVFGLSSIGKPLEEVCLGLEEAKRILAISETGHIITPGDGVKLISSFAGGRKNLGNRSYYAMINQCDIPNGMEYGMEMLEALQEKGIEAFLSCRT